MPGCGGTGAANEPSAASVAVPTLVQTPPSWRCTSTVPPATAGCTVPDSEPSSVTTGVTLTRTDVLAVPTVSRSHVACVGESVSAYEPSAAGAGSATGVHGWAERCCSSTAVPVRPFAPTVSWSVPPYGTAVELGT